MATIRKTKNKRKTSYQTTIWVPDPNSPGSSIQKKITRPTRKELLEEVKRVEIQIYEGKFTHDTKETIGAWAPKAIRIQKDLSGMKEQSFQTYMKELRHIIPELGSLKLTEVDSVFLENWLRDYQKRGNKHNGGELLHGSINMIRKVLNIIFDQARRQKLIRHNPMVEVKTPRARKLEKKVYTKEELDRLLAVFPHVDYGDFMEVMARTGIRFGEAKALRWSDFRWSENDPERKHLLIDESLIVRFYEGKKYCHQGAPKSENGFRDLPLDDRVRRILEDRSIQQKKDKLQAGSGWQGGDTLDRTFIFTDEEGLSICYKTFLRRLKKATEAAGVPYEGAHILRRTYQTNLRRQGVPLEVAAKLLGHTKETSLKFYDKMGDESELVQAVESLSRYLGAQAI